VLAAVKEIDHGLHVAGLEVWQNNGDLARVVAVRVLQRQPEHGTRGCQDDSVTANEISTVAAHEAHVGAEAAGDAGQTGAQHGHVAHEANR
jgi:hypothetical protein